MAEWYRKENGEIDREKVIDELERDFERMPDEESHVVGTFDREAVGCALELLKAQEPRVMTLEEAKDSAGKDMFLEIISCPEEPSYITAATLDGVGRTGVTFYHNTFDFCRYNKEQYGWRCWTSRPTEEQRKAVK